MYSNMNIAIAVIAVLVGVIVVGLGVLFSMKLKEIRKRRDEEAFRARFSDWFTYILANADGDEPLFIPNAPLSKAERRIVRERLVHWIEQFKGVPQRRLIELAERMGLVSEQLKRLDSPFEWVKLDAAYHLGCMRSAQAVPGMMELLKSLKPGPLAYIPARAIAKCAARADELREVTDVLLSHKKDAQPLIADILRESELDYAPMLATFLRSSDPERVKLALAAMTGSPADGVADTLYKLTGSEEKELSLEAARLLLKNRKALTQERIARLFAHPEPDVRAVTAEAIGELGLTSSVGMLAAGLSDPEWQVRFGSGRSLARLGEGGIAALREAAESDSEIRRETALAVLRETSGRRRRTAS
ncbi:HEAT repeat domain-containing protein [Cohnella thailandensis]|uniref:HEAT repeat domain-containing protein n=1 Tax=Cohnella thailandensis TaxID=557557 RepID=A0A841SW62_9BACL|nr:HEAT repeat domain-containing protein [Cohnella thailandensis]MBB6634856.1 HEAT repeat domain-containing protein [Cohnella thailandensis]MBP1975922.1 HEAT repeat protein [Cohnella thailandensis]